MLVMGHAFGRRLKANERKVWMVRGCPLHQALLQGYVALAVGV